MLFVSLNGFEGIAIRLDKFSYFLIERVLPSLSVKRMTPASRSTLMESIALILPSFFNASRAQKSQRRPLT